MLLKYGGFSINKPFDNHYGDDKLFVYNCGFGRLDMVKFLIKYVAFQMANHSIFIAVVI